MKDQRPIIEPTDVRGLIRRKSQDIMWLVMDLRYAKRNAHTQFKFQKIINLTDEIDVLSECVTDWVDPTIECKNQHPGADYYFSGTDEQKFYNHIFCTKPKGHTGSCGCGGYGHNKVMWG